MTVSSRGVARPHLSHILAGVCITSGFLPHRFFSTCGVPDRISAGLLIKYFYDQLPYHRLYEMEHPYIKTFNIPLEELKRRFEEFPGIMSILEMPISANEQLSKPVPIDVVDVIYSIGLLGWSAHTIYDDIRDGEPDAGSISIANKHVNDMYSLRASLSLDNEQEIIISNLLSKMEHANFMEESNIDHHGFIYRSTWKSMGAALPLILLLMKAGIERSAIDRCLAYFYHLIAGRQLSDDAVDWQDDLMSDRHSLVSYLIMEQATENRTTEVPLDLNEIFESKVKPTVASRIAYHAKMAIGLAKKMTCFKNTDFLVEMPSSYREMAENILAKY